MSHLNQGVASRVAAYLNAAPLIPVLGNQWIIYDGVLFDGLDEYDNVTGIFTVREAGYYLLSLTALITNPLFVAVRDLFSALVIGVYVPITIYTATPPLDLISFSASAVVYLTPLTPVRFNVNAAGAGEVVTNGMYINHFEAHRLS